LYDPQKKTAIIAPNGIEERVFVLSCILGVFAEFRKAAISFVVSVRPSVFTEELGSHQTDFHEIFV
jgi:hypothetical protein